MLDLLRQFEEQQKQLEEIQRAGLDGEEAGPDAEKRKKERKELEDRIAGLDLGAFARIHRKALRADAFLPYRRLDSRPAPLIPHARTASRIRGDSAGPESGEQAGRGGV